jgi:DNA-binding transcriptional regulator PaaX
MVKQEMLRQQDSQFRKSFLAANPNLPEKPSPKEWASAYARTLKNDFDYLAYVERMARLSGTVFQKGELEKLVRAELSGNTSYSPGRSPSI